mmetsp:Transcript_89615/g.269334  ORF Transcript_89615/g.269334 Transcript_89615/m.269334 type:complete len:212 (-) Transcript_89615:31-666(-)
MARAGRVATEEKVVRGAAEAMAVVEELVGRGGEAVGGAAAGEARVREGRGRLLEGNVRRDAGELLLEAGDHLLLGLLLEGEVARLLAVGAVGEGRVRDTPLGHVLRHDGEYLDGRHALGRVQRVWVLERGACNVAAKGPRRVGCLAHRLVEAVGVVRVEAPIVGGAHAIRVVQLLGGHVEGEARVEQSLRVAEALDLGGHLLRHRLLWQQL